MAASQEGAPESKEKRKNPHDYEACFRIRGHMSSAVKNDLAMLVANNDLSIEGVRLED
jgi:hypothetical protein